MSLLSRRSFLASAAASVVAAPLLSPDVEVPPAETPPEAARPAAPVTTVQFDALPPLAATEVRPSLAGGACRLKVRTLRGPGDVVRAVLGAYARVDQADPAKTLKVRVPCPGGPPLLLAVAAPVVTAFSAVTVDGDDLVVSDVEVAGVLAENGMTGTYLVESKYAAPELIAGPR